LVGSAEYRARTEILTTVSIYGRDFVVRAGSTMYGDGYEEHIYHRLMRFTGRGKRFLDVGANIGVFAIHAALRGAEVIAVEARPSNNSLILENARRAHVSVELHPLAVSDCHGYAVLEVAAENENAEIRPQASTCIGDYVVALTLLDELIGDRQIDVMKIDIEGHEYRAMLGARKMLARCRPVIVTEYSPGLQQRGSGVPGSVYLEYLEQFGYGFSVMLRSGELKPAGGIAEIDELCRQLGYHVDLLLEPIPGR
jgi:FkbM family methyltransferase